MMLQQRTQVEPQGQARELEAAFSDFNQASTYLGEVFRDLENRVSTLNTELSHARHERVRQFEEKERLALRLQNLLRVLPAGVVVLDSNGMVVENNPAALNLLGEPLLGQAWRDVVARSFSPRWDDGHDISLADNRCVNISTQSLEEDAGQLILIKEVTETRQLQQQLGRLKRLSAMGEMASSLAHQIRTPLSSALLYASNLQHAAVDSTRRSRFIGKLIGRLQHLESLVEDMLLFARGGNFDAKIHSMESLLGEFRESVEAQLEQTGTQLDIEFASTDIHVRVNQHALISILQNLMNNAIQVCDKPPRIRIVVSLDGNASMQLRFSDNGPGIDEDIQSSIFEPFFTTRSQGSGLGLAVADSVVRSHGGRIALCSSSTQGTVFQICLPTVKK